MSCLNPWGCGLRGNDKTKFVLASPWRRKRGAGLTQEWHKNLKGQANALNWDIDQAIHDLLTGEYLRLCDRSEQDTQVVEFWGTC